MFRPLINLLFMTLVTCNWVEYSIRTLNYHMEMKIKEVEDKGYDGCENRCTSHGESWINLIVPDLHFFYFLDTIKREKSYLLGLCRKQSNFHTWQDRYKTKTFNADDKCELWLHDEPDSISQTIGLIREKNPAKNFTRNKNTAYEHHALSDYKPTANFYLACSNIKVTKLEPKFIISDPNRQLIRKIIAELPNIDYKLIYGYEYCFNDTILTFPEGKASLIYKHFDRKDFV
ncbi:hypothetical protein SNEBB_011402 [Seison nebaliae]|nr:hypothetical protein SNEBB_011402 [Seison nebaliae]